MFGLLRMACELLLNFFPTPFFLSPFLRHDYTYPSFIYPKRFSHFELPTWSQWAWIDGSQTQTNSTDDDENPGNLTASTSQELWFDQSKSVHHFCCRLRQLSFINQLNTFWMTIILWALKLTRKISDDLMVSGCSIGVSKAHFYGDKVSSYLCAHNNHDGIDFVQNLLEPQFID